MDLKKALEEKLQKFLRHPRCKYPNVYQPATPAASSTSIIKSSQEHLGTYLISSEVIFDLYFLNLLPELFHQWPSVLEAVPVAAVLVEAVVEVAVEDLAVIVVVAVVPVVVLEVL